MKLVVEILNCFKRLQGFDLEILFINTPECVWLMDSLRWVWFCCGNFNISKILATLKKNRSRFLQMLEKSSVEQQR